MTWWESAAEAQSVNDPQAHHPDCRCPECCKDRAEGSA